MAARPSGNLKRVPSRLLSDSCEPERSPSPARRKNPRYKDSDTNADGMWLTLRIRNERVSPDGLEYEIVWASVKGKKYQNSWHPAEFVEKPLIDQWNYFKSFRAHYKKMSPPEGKSQQSLFAINLFSVHGRRLVCVAPTNYLVCSARARRSGSLYSAVWRNQVPG